MGFILTCSIAGYSSPMWKRDVAEANIFIGSLIFVQELADKVVEAVEPMRDQLDAVISPIDTRFH